MKWVECHKALGSALSRQEEYVCIITILHYININICYHDTMTVTPLHHFSIMLHVQLDKFLRVDNEMVRLDELSWDPSLEPSYHVISLLWRIITSWSNTCTAGRSVLNVSPAPSGTSRLSGELFWSATSLGSVVDPSANQLLQTFFSLGLRLLLGRFC